MTKDELIAKTFPTRFQKGKSGNSGGWTKMQRELRALAAESVPDALRVAREIMMKDDNTNRDRLDACKFLTSYGLGAPPKMIEERQDERADDMGQLSVDELRALARQSLVDDAVPTDDDDDESGEAEH